MSDSSGYSPAISMELQVGVERFTVGSIGGETMILRDARAVPPSTGIMRLTLDGRMTSYQVELPQGIDPSRRDQVVRIIREPDVAAVA